MIRMIEHEGDVPICFRIWKVFRQAGSNIFEPIRFGKSQILVIHEQIRISVTVSHARSLCNAVMGKRAVVSWCDIDIFTDNESVRFVSSRLHFVALQQRLHLNSPMYATSDKPSPCIPNTNSLHAQSINFCCSSRHHTRQNMHRRNLLSIPSTLAPLPSSQIHICWCGINPEPES